MFLSERKGITECKCFQSYIKNALFIRDSTHFYYSVRGRQDERKKPSLDTRIFAFFYIFIFYGVSPFHGLLSLCNSLRYSPFYSTCTVKYDFVIWCVFLLLLSNNLHSILLYQRAHYCPFQKEGGWPFFE
jgi:hypothetical protein